MLRQTVLALLLATGATTPAAAVVAIVHGPAQTFANFSQQSPARGAVPKLAYYKNEDSVKTTGVTVKTPHTTTTMVTTTATVNITTYKTTYVTTINPVTHKSTTTKVVTPIVTPTQVTTTKPVTTTTYTSVTTYSTKVTPKAEIYTTVGSGSQLASPVVGFRYISAVPQQVQAQLAGVQQAKFTLDTVSTSAAVITGSNVSQLFDTGTITFFRTAPVIVHDYKGRVVGAPLSNLLTISFTNATLYGSLGSSAFTLDAATPDSTVTYSSDFLNFTNNFNSGISLTFNAAVPQLSVATTAPSAINQTNVTGAHSLNSTRATVAGQFSASSVPEPAVWSLMLAGFALVGLRRRRFAVTRVVA